MADYESLKVTELKTLLKERQISATGLTRKAQYIQALIDDDKAAQATELDENTTEADATVAQGSDDNAPAQLQTEVAKDEPVTAVDDKKVESAADTSEADLLKEEKSEDKSEDKSEEKVEEKVEEVVEESAEEKVEENTTKDAETEKVENIGDAQVDAENAVRSESPSTSDKKRKRDLSIEKEDANNSITKKARMQDGQEARTNDQHQGNAAAEPTSKDVDIPEISSKTVSDIDQLTDDAEELSSLPSTHAITNALYIRNLMRPLQAQAFRSDLLALSGLAQDAITDLYLDSIKIHAFVICQSNKTAIRLRKALHEKPWPQHESGRKALWVDFVPENMVKDWIDEEQRAGRDARFEVIYDQDASGNSIARLSEVGSRPVAPREPPAHRELPPQRDIEAPGQGMPGAPSGPRGHVAQRRPSPTPEATRKPQNTSFNKLDQFFKFTTAKPKIYYQVVDKNLADRRLDELDRETSRDWQKGKSWNRSTRLASIDQLRRYTFDDGDHVVDGGMDFGGFGRHQGAGGSGAFNPSAPRGGGGRGGRGGYRP